MLARTNEVPYSRAKSLLWLPLGLLVGIAIYEGYHPPPPAGYPPDFSIFQTAAAMVRSGMSNHLYDPEKQKDVFFGIVGPTFSQFLVWNHPPSEALVYLPFAFVNFDTGLRIMRILNSLFLSAIVLWSACRMRSRSHSLALMAVALMFSLRPLSGTISTGQDSLWILLVTLAALSAVIDDHLAAGALLLGLASIKFTIILPLLAIFSLIGFQALVLDAVLATLLVWLIPVILLGPPVLISYIRLCFHLLSVDSQMGLHSGLLWNFRGILLRFMSDPMGVFYLTLAVGLACAVLVRLLPRRHAIPASLIVATFFSPHVYQHDAIMYTGGIILYIFMAGRHSSPPRPIPSSHPSG